MVFVVAGAGDRVAASDNAAADPAAIADADGIALLGVDSRPQGADGILI